LFAAAFEAFRKPINGEVRMESGSSVVARLEELKVIPVAAVEDASDAVPLAEALKAGRLPCLEITFRTEAAADALARAASVSGLLVGAGTVITAGQAAAAVDAGASFLVSPGIEPKVIEYGLKRGVPVFPGVTTPTEILTALSFGLDVLKFFPAEASGGPKMLKAVSSPFAGVRFIPTGGIDAGNLSAYLALSCVLACGGSWLAGKKLVAEHSFDEITRLAREALALC